MPVTSFSVDLLVRTPNQLRQISLDLAKDSKADGTVTWSLHFKLEERTKTIDPFALVVELDVEINPENHDKAEATAQHGLDDDQTSSALVAADTAKAFKNKKVSKRRAIADTQDVIASRNPNSPTV